MRNIEEIVKGLEEYNKGFKIEKITDKKYYINTGLFFIESCDILPIYLIEHNGRICFADYGLTLKSLNVNFNNLDTKTKMLINQKLNELEVEFDGGTMLLETISNNEVFSLNVFISCMMFIQTLI
jgi:hypothetical protein